MLRHLAFVLILAAAFPGMRAAQAIGFHKGDRVVIHEGATITPDNKRLDPARTPPIYVVGRVDGSRLWVIDDHSSVSGWIEAADVLTPARAIEGLSESIRRAPTARDHEARGIIRVALGELDAALADYAEAIRLDPRSAGPHIKRAHVWRARNEYDRSMTDLDEAIRLDPLATVAFNDRGNGWRRIGEYGKALADYDEAIRVEPDYPIAYNNRAWLLATCPEDGRRDARRAIEDARKTCELTDWKYPNGFDSLATAYAEAGDFKRAIEWEEKAIAFPRMSPAPRAWEARRDLYKAGKPFREQPKIRKP